MSQPSMAASGLFETARRALVVCPDLVAQQGLCRILQGLEVFPLVAKSPGEADALTGLRGPFRLTVIDAGQDGGRGPRDAFGGAGSATRIRGRSSCWPIARTRLRPGRPTSWAPSRSCSPRGPSRALQTAIVKVVLARPRPPAADGAAYDDAGTRLQQELALWRSPEDAARSGPSSSRPPGSTSPSSSAARPAPARTSSPGPIHHLLAPSGRPFVKVNCAAVPAELLESELFGHERGAFTGAHQLRDRASSRRPTAASCSSTRSATCIPRSRPSSSTSSRTACSRGSAARSTVKVDVRVVAATNRDLERRVAEGRFREDLYYRLNVVQIIVPPLRERLEEIPLLADYFVRRYARLFRREGFAVSPTPWSGSMRHQLPGQRPRAREHRQAHDRARRPAPGARAPRSAEARRPRSARRRPAPPCRDRVSLKDIARAAARAAEREAIARVLKETRWNRVRAAKLLDQLPRPALQDQGRRPGSDAQRRSLTAPVVSSVDGGVMRQLTDGLRLQSAIVRLAPTPDGRRPPRTPKPATGRRTGSPIRTNTASGPRTCCRSSSGRTRPEPLVPSAGRQDLAAAPGRRAGAGRPPAELRDTL